MHLLNLPAAFFIENTRVSILRSPVEQPDRRKPSDTLRHSTTEQLNRLQHHLTSF